ncbi:MAG: SDR family oxidoreductase [Marinobacter sp.]|jgi:3-oxoacyl-[acyl-carrier protein] reductase
MPPSPAPERLSNQVAIVTGSARNIGRAIALRLVAEGAAVVINARTSQGEVNQVVAEIRQMGGRAVGCLADVTQPKDVTRLVQCAISEFGQLDILVNNAAVRREARLDDITLEDWRSTLAIILDGAFLCAQAAAPYLRQSSAGSIVNIGGMTGSSGGSNRVHVVTAKAALIGLTKALAWDLAEDNVTVNLISPGMVETARVNSKPKHHAVHRPLLGRRGTPEEIAGMVVTLSGPDGRFMTGQSLHVNGGAYLP